MPVASTRVLIVDDRSASREHISIALRARGYRTLEAEDGRAGLTAFEEHAPEAVVTDMRMPRADGFELLEGVRQRADVPVFCVTAYPEWDSALLAMRRGATYYYRWPSEFDRLIADVDEALRGGAPDRAASEGPFSLESIRREAGRDLALERKSMVESALRATGGNVGQAAELLRISRRTIYHWMERYGVERDGT